MCKSTRELTNEPLYYSVIDALGPKKKIDLFQLARQISPVEETTPILVKFIREGLFSHIGLSEVSADTLRRAHDVSINFSSSNVIVVNLCN